MTLEKAQEIANLYEDRNGVAARVREGYSGRYMYGKKVAAVVAGDINELVYCAKACGVRSPRKDNMGLSYIIY